MREGKLFFKCLMFSPAQNPYTDNSISNTFASTSFSQLSPFPLIFYLPLNFRLFLSRHLSIPRRRTPPTPSQPSLSNERVANNPPSLHPPHPYPSTSHPTLLPSLLPSSSGRSGVVCEFYASRVNEGVAFRERGG